MPRLPTALFNLPEEPGVPAGPKLLPVVPWLFALLEFAPGAPPVPFTLAPVLSVVPDPDDVPPVEELGEPPELPAEPPAAPPAEPAPPPPPPCARADMGDSRAATRSILHKSEEDMDHTPFPRPTPYQTTCSEARERINARPLESRFCGVEFPVMRRSNWTPSSVPRGNDSE